MTSSNFQYLLQWIALSIMHVNNFRDMGTTIEKNLRYIKEALYPESLSMTLET